MKKTMVEITTADTKKTYLYDHSLRHGDNGNPDLWEIECVMKRLDKQSGLAIPHEYAAANFSVHIERETAEKSGLLYLPEERRGEVTDTPEDLMVRLLNSLGFQQQE